MRFTIFQDSAIGARTINQDRMGYCYSREALLAIVADGMGGHLRGEVAAQLSLQTAAALFQQAAQPRLRDPAQFLDEALRAGHRELHRYREQHGMPECPRTTVVACVIQDNQAWWAHAGDSRLYVFRRGKSVARTRDHSKVENLISLGLITAEDAETHPERNKVLNCLGSPFEPSIEINAAFPLHDDDVIVLCSDGFWSGQREHEMAGALTGGEPVATLVPRLVRQAVEKNGINADNTTALVLRWHDETEAEPIPTLSSLGLPDGAVTTTIAIAQAGDREAAEGDLSEDEIERTIAEIQQAIQRSNRTA